MMAIRVLLDHDVPQHKINLVSLLMAESGEINLNYEKFILTSIWSKYSQICYSTMYCKFWSPFINIGHLPSVMAECVKNLFGDSWSCLWCKFSPTCNGSNVKLEINNTVKTCMNV